MNRQERRAASRNSRFGGGLALPTFPDMDRRCMEAVETVRTRLRNGGQLAEGETIEEAFAAAITPVVSEACSHAGRQDVKSHAIEVARIMVADWKNTPFGRTLFDYKRPIVTVGFQ